jgi:hypothetical protein
MDLDRFWSIIEKSRRGAADAEAQGERLIALLEQLEAEEIIAFERVLQERIRDAFRNDLWAVAYIMNGGCSDDGFDYFIGWLIGRGRKRYDVALADPERAADRVSPDDEPFENEMAWYAPARAYAHKTGRDDFDLRCAPAVTRTLQGEGWEEDDLEKLHPRLWKRFLGE